MTTKPSAPKASAIDPDRLYRVDLARSIKVGRSFVHPGPRVLLRGDAIVQAQEEFEGAVEGFEPFDA